MKTLLAVCHSPSENTLALQNALLKGMTNEQIEAVHIIVKAPLETSHEDVLQADGIILGTTENFANMAGLTKDFFERIYYPVLEQKQGMPLSLYIRAGNDGTGTLLNIEKIITGLKWRMVQPPLVLKGPFSEAFSKQVEELGMTMAAGLEASIF